MKIIAFVAQAFLSIFLYGCATSSIPPEKQKDYAFLDVDAHFGAAKLMYIVMVDQQTYMRSPMGTSRDVFPGRHTVKVDTCVENKANVLAPTCKSNNYILDAKAGLAYKFNSVYSVEVYDRFNLDKLLYNLTPTENSLFVAPDEAEQFRAKRQKILEARLAGEQDAHAAAEAIVIERRKNNLPMVRKIGTRICQEQSGGVINVGYVEALAEEKVQIRISDAYMKNNRNARPGSFSPSIIWDSRHALGSVRVI